MIIKKIEQHAKAAREIRATRTIDSGYARNAVENNFASST
ncbi:hypothetical protein [Carp edema virus]|nr:hypothetical protein [Carp edema virus]